MDHDNSVRISGDVIPHFINLSEIKIVVIQTTKIIIKYSIFSPK